MGNWSGYGTSHHAEVAELAGVSQATVSRALRGVGKVAPKTRAKVEAAADRLGFTLSKSASSLASGKTMRVVLLFSGKLNEWFNANVLQGVCEVLEPEATTCRPHLSQADRRRSVTSHNCLKIAMLTRSSFRRSNSTNPHVRNCVSPICDGRCEHSSRIVLRRSHRC